jgi:hypothetical protein
MLNAVFATEFLDLIMRVYHASFVIMPHRPLKHSTFFSCFFIFHILYWVRLP